MKRDKMPHVVAQVPPARSVGRPRKFRGRTHVSQVRLPEDLVQAAERIIENRKLPDFTDGIRELMRTGAESLGLVEPRN